MKVVLASVGRDRNDPLTPLVEDYAGRIRRWADVELVDVKEEPLRRTSSPAVVMAKEAERLRPKTVGRVVAFDRLGKRHTSLEWSDRLGAWREGATSVTFVVGGPLGLDPAFLASADETWSLGPLTLPHRIARLVVAEQLYRAVSILRDEPYHK